MGEYLYTDRHGTAIHTGDTVKSFHSQFSDNAFIIGKMVGRGPVDDCPCGADHLTIEVITDVQRWTDSDGDVQWHRSNRAAGTMVYPACVEITHGGAVIELHTFA